MDKQRVGQGGQAVKRLGIVTRNRLITQIARGHHQRPISHQEVMQGRVGQHDPEERIARSHTRSKRSWSRWLSPPAQQYDRPGPADQEAFLGRVDLDVTASQVQGRDHEREGLVHSPLSLSKPRDSLVVRRVASQVEASQPLDSDDPPVGQNRLGKVEGLFALRPVAGVGWPKGGFRGPHRRHKPQARAAQRTSVRLRVEPAVGGVVIFGFAGRTHGKYGHRSPWAVVGQVAQNRESRTAIRAVEKRIAIAAIGRIEKLPNTLVASGDVRSDGGASSIVAAFDDDKAPLFDGSEILSQERIDDRERRRLIPQRVLKGLDGFAQSLDLDEDTGRLVAHQPSQTEALRESVDEWTEADSLNHTPDQDSPSDAEAGTRCLFR